MQRSIFVTLLAVLLLGSSASSQDATPAPTLADAAWLAGAWRNPAAAKGDWEEHWSAPRNGAMIGMFRLKQTSGMLYEFLLIEEEKDGVWMRLRHYRARMQDVDKEPLRLKLIAAADKKLVFENPDHDKPKRITYQFEAPSKMIATIETQRDGKPARFALKFERAGAR